MGIIEVGDGVLEKRTELKCRRCGGKEPLWRVFHPEASVVGYRCKGMREQTNNYWGEKMLGPCGFAVAVHDGNKTTHKLV